MSQSPESPAASDSAYGNDVGIYLVTLSNVQPISVNAQDPRIATRCLHVTLINCKIGKAHSFKGRERNYWKTFGAQHVQFRPIACTSEPRAAERVILRALLPWRLRSPAGRRTEWLGNIAPDDAERVALEALRDAEIAYTKPTPTIAM
ncbi:MAG: hypothetical protein ABI411_18710 [Tahibacter sp.]